MIIFSPDPDPTHPPLPKMVLQDPKMPITQPEGHTGRQTAPVGSPLTILSNQVGAHFVQTAPKTRKTPNFCVVNHFKCKIVHIFARDDTSDPQYAKLLGLTGHQVLKGCSLVHINRAIEIGGCIARYGPQDWKKANFLHDWPFLVPGGAKNFISARTPHRTST